jgi:hypothetical protein
MDGTNIFYSHWLATATGQYRLHPAFGWLVRAGIVASGGTVKAPRITLAAGSGQ